MPPIALDPVQMVFLAALVTALATGLGALPLLATRAAGPRWVSRGNALAAGLMLAASTTLIAEGFDLGPLRTLAGVVLGVGLILLADRWLKSRGKVRLGEIGGADARRILLIMGIMTAHSAAEGLGVGVAWGGGAELGGFITLAIALHNVPEGLAIALVMVPRGASVGRAALWAVGSSLPQPLLAVPAFLFVLQFVPVLPVGLGLAAGAMLWMIFAELIPEAQRDLPGGAMGAVVVLAFAAMMLVTLWL